MRFLLPILLLLPLCAQPLQDAPQGSPQSGGERKHEPPKNLKILKPEQVGGAMRAFTVALGVRCDYCHVRGDFASDDNPKKNTARHMLEMEHQINAHFDDGKMHVSCYTCHRGATEPAVTPPAPAAQ